MNDLLRDCLKEQARIIRSDLILDYIHAHPGCRMREIASAINLWQCDKRFLDAMFHLEKSGEIYAITHNDPANMEFYDEWYIKEAD